MRDRCLRYGIRACCSYAAFRHSAFFAPLPGEPGFFQYALSKPEPDKAHKDKKHEIFAESFRVDMEFFDEDVL